MGEYAIRKSDQQRIKIGTCESMYYLRWDDRLKVSKVPGSLDPATEANLYWRLPLPSEDAILPGGYDDYNATAMLMPWDDEGHLFDYTPPAGMDPGSFQMHHQATGLLLNVKCHHGVKLPEESADIKAGWNGKSPHAFELCGVKNHELADGHQELLPLVRCRHCRSMFRESWAGVLNHVRDQELRDRLTEYAVSSIPTSSNPTALS